MGVVLPVIGVTAFWLLIGIGGPFLIPKGPNKGIIQTMVIMTAVCCWSFWFMVYLHQVNPLIGPQIPVGTIRWISHQWGDSAKMAPE